MRRIIKQGLREYRFGEFRFIPERQLLLYGEDVLRVGSRALDLLHLLVSRAGEVVSKEELTKFVWPSTHIHESNLKVNIAALRRALPRAPSDPPLIATVAGRGYRFAAPVRVMTGASAHDLPDGVRRQSGELPTVTDPVGREDALADLEARILTRPAVTIVGPAGVGKTTVAVAAGWQLSERFPDGVYFVDLALLDDSRLVGPAIAAALGVAGDFTDLLAALAAVVGSRRPLIILDNCEHVLSAAATISEQLRAAVPGVHVLATSREPLRSRDEAIYRLAPLEFPGAGSDLHATEALSFSAVRLFVRRAEEAHGFRLDDADAPVVAAICRRLDGIALAIELAVSRLSACDPTTLLHALDQSFEPLNLGAGTDRQRTLMATLEWSYRLLSEDDARLFRQLSAFTGAFSFDDIVGTSCEGDIPVEEIAARTESLVSKSLLSRGYQEGGLRYRLLDSTRSFAADALQHSGNSEAVLRRFADYLLEVFERAEAEWQWRAREEWTGSYAPRANDLRKAIDWAFGDPGDPLVGIRLTAAAIPFWDELSTVNESRLRVRRALDSDALARCGPELRMKLVAAYASGLNFSDHLGADADTAWEEAYRLAGEVGDVDYRLRALWGHAVLQSFSGRHREALATLDRFEAVADSENDRAALPDGQRLRLMTSFYCGDIAGARDRLEILAREHGSEPARARMARFQIDRFVGMRVALALMRWMQGEERLALATIGEALDRADKLGHLVSQSNALAQSGLPLALQIGDVRLAKEYAATLARNLNLREIAIWGPVSRFYDGAIASAEGKPGSVDAMHLAIEQLVRNRFLIRVPLYLSIAAEAALGFGRAELAGRSIDEAFERADAQEERWCRPELLRVKALVQWQAGDRTGAERTLAAAIEQARESGALSFQLRSATLFAHWLLELGRTAEAERLLAPLFARFDASFPSRDVTRAAAVLAAINNGDG